MNLLFVKRLEKGRPLIGSFPLFYHETTFDAVFYRANNKSLEKHFFSHIDKTCLFWGRKDTIFMKNVVSY